LLHDSWLLTRHKSMLLAIIRYLTGNLIAQHAPEADDTPKSRASARSAAGPTRRASNISASVTTHATAAQAAADQEEAAQAAVFAGREAELDKLTQMLQSSDFVAVQVHDTLSCTLSYTLSCTLTPLIHSSHTLLSYTPLIHSSHTLLSYTPLTHSSHTILRSSSPRCSPRIRCSS
jgi:hypothetical protein